jgi:hypothetical protein
MSTGPRSVQRAGFGFEGQPGIPGPARHRLGHHRRLAVHDRAPACADALLNLKRFVTARIGGDAGMQARAAQVRACHGRRRARRRPWHGRRGGRQRVPGRARRAPGAARFLTFAGAIADAEVAYRMAATQYVDGNGEQATLMQQTAVDLRRRTAELKKRAPTTADKATVEIVALMFQAILAEERIPFSARVWFARLQMPVLRVAIAEPEFFGTCSTRRAC